MTPTVAIACLLFTAATFAYVFWPQGRLSHQHKKTRLEYLRERREVVYENLRDLNFENKAGKLSPEDYESLRASLEDEAAELLAEIEHLERLEMREAEA